MTTRRRDGMMGTVVDLTAIKGRGRAGVAGRNGIIVVACLLVDNNPHPHLDISLIRVVVHCAVSLNLSAG
jgi:hypothetical protein